MPSPPISIFLTTIASQPALRQRQEYILRTLQVKKIPFTSYDLASDESAKRLWKRKAPLDKQQLPGILVGNQFAGTFSEFEDAVEYDELDTFLRLKESYKEDSDDERVRPPVQPVGVPGASSPRQMTPEHLKTTIFAPVSSPLKGKGKPVTKRDNEFDVGTKLVGFGLQGVQVTEDELRDLVAELGLDGDEAGDLVKGLAPETGKDAGPVTKDEVPPKTSEADAKPDDKNKKTAETTEEQPKPTADATTAGGEAAKTQTAPEGSQ
ncbi:hypothetical protein BD779DRAFT_1486098 [Infundibulicybe gibba]|nr:hypothetical protein BD779DRAFT_1486098 [Infundibulicybe gibba]